MSLDLHGIGNSMFPLMTNLSSNPVRDKWFPIILTDEIWFYTIVYVAAKVLEMENGALHNTQDASRLMNLVLGKLKDSVGRARRGHIPTDTVIGAVSCLVSLEVCQILSTSARHALLFNFLNSLILCTEYSW
jgi:hypothetical protein